MSLKGRKNAYWCPDCHGYVVTIDIDEGVTPMFLACRVNGEPPLFLGCRGMMQSMMYPDEPWPEQDGYGRPIPTEPTWEWYTPTESVLKRLRRRDPGGYEHVRQGGLLLRRVA